MAPVNQRSHSRLLKSILSIRIPGFIIPVSYFFAPAFLYFYSTLIYNWDFIQTRVDSNFSNPFHVEVFDFIVGKCLRGLEIHLSNIGFIELSGKADPTGSLRTACNNMYRLLCFSP
jgi:hypothetical protein